MGESHTAASRVDYRLTYDRTSGPRSCHMGGIDGPDIPNAYFGRGLVDAEDDDEFGSGCWDDPEHPNDDMPAEAHIARWFQTAVREAIHEAMEWFWVDGQIYLDPHGQRENEIHHLSERFGEQLLKLRDQKES